MPDNEKSQLDKFREAARQLECDDDQARFDEKLGKMVKPLPKPSKIRSDD